MRLVFAKENKDIFEAVRNGVKKVETRAATKKYLRIQKGDIVDFSCEGVTFSKEVIEVKVFSSVKELLKVYAPKDINPKLSTENEVTEMYASFPGYLEKIKEFGLVALLLK